MYQTLPRQTIAASINISEEEVIKPFDNFQFKETPTQKAKCVNIQNETSKSPKKNRKLKEKTFFIHHNNHAQTQKEKSYLKGKKKQYIIFLIVLTYSI